MNEALSPSMNVLPTPSVTQLLYSLVVSSDFSAGFSAFFSSAGFAAVDSCAARGPSPIKHAPAMRVRILRTLCAHGAPEPASGPLTPSLSPSAGERVPEGRVRGSPDDFWIVKKFRLMSRAWAV